MGKLYPYAVRFTDTDGIKHNLVRYAPFGDPSVNGLEGSKTILRGLRNRRPRQIDGRRVRVDTRLLIVVKPSLRGGE